MNPPKYNAEIRSRLEKLYIVHDSGRMSPYERVTATINRQPSDRIPFDFWAVPEMITALKSLLGAKDDEELLQLLGIDCRIITPEYIGPEPQKLSDGTFYAIWGSHRKLFTNEFSTYEEYASYPLAEVKTVSDVETWTRWPKTQYWNWKTVVPKIHNVNKTTHYHIRYDIGGIFESAWGLYGLDRFLTDLYDHPEIPCAIMDCYADLMIANVHSLMTEARGLIDIVYTYDDVATQNSLMMSPAMWRKFILPRHLRLNQVIKSYGLKILYHSCGAIYPLIEPLINKMGIDVLNPLQPRAAMIDMAKIKSEFGSRIAFHGGIDLQQTMSQGTPVEVQNEVTDRIRVLGKGGGYICTTAHYIQADTPLLNVIALYTAPRN